MHPASLTSHLRFAEKWDEHYGQNGAFAGGTRILGIPTRIVGLLAQPPSLELGMDNMDEHYGLNGQYGHYGQYGRDKGEW